MNKEFISNFMNHQEFPVDSIKEFTRVMDIIDGNEYFKGYFDSVLDSFWADGEYWTGNFQRMSDILSPKCGIHTYTLQMMFLLAATPELWERYKKEGIEEQIFWDSMLDLRAKLIECYNCKHIWGTFVTGWFGRFYEMTRFALGRFQFEENTFDRDGVGDYSKNGYTLKKGEVCYGFHIPSHPVPLTDEVRMASYKKAYEFYKTRRGDNTPIFFNCSSWLLFKPYAEALPEKSNIRKFQSDFDIRTISYGDDFGDAWRVYDDKAELPVEDWPEDTSMRKSLKKYFLEGGRPGSGWGMIVFDGENIVNK